MNEDNSNTHLNRIVDWSVLGILSALHIGLIIGFIIGMVTTTTSGRLFWLAISIGISIMLTRKVLKLSRR